MFSFFVWETVNIPMLLIGKDDETGILNDCKDVVISFYQQGFLLEFYKDDANVGIDVENDKLNVYLGQEQTGMFKPDVIITVQVNVLYENAERNTTCTGAIRPLANLHRKIMR